MADKQEGYKVPETPLVLNPNYKPQAKEASAAQTERPDSSEASQFATHVVKKGDTLSAIAKQYLGSANRYPEIFQLNKDILKDPDHIEPGQTLKIPQTKH